MLTSFNTNENTNLNGSCFYLLFLLIKMVQMNPLPVVVQVQPLSSFHFQKLVQTTQIFLIIQYLYILEAFCSDHNLPTSKCTRPKSLTTPSIRLISTFTPLSKTASPLEPLPNLNSFCCLSLE